MQTEPNGIAHAGHDTAALREAQFNRVAWGAILAGVAAALITQLLLTSAVGGLLGGAFSVIGSTINGAGKVAATTASGVAGMTDGDAVYRQASRIVDPNGAQNVQASVTDYLEASAAGDPQAAQQAKGQAVNALAQSAHITPAEAGARLDQLEANARQTYQAAKAKAMQAAEATRKAVATAAIVSFVTLLLGAVAGWFGAGVGSGLHDRVAHRIRRDDGASLR